MRRIVTTGIHLRFRRSADVWLGGSRLVRSDPHQLLTEIGALEKPDERGRRAVETLGDEFAMFDLALAHPLRHVAQKISMTRGEFADDKAADSQALGEHVAHQR